MKDNAEKLSAQMAALVEVQMEVIPFLRDNGYPPIKLLELQNQLQKIFDAGEVIKGRGPRKGHGGRPRKTAIA